MKTCETCRFWDKKDFRSTEDKGQCRRYPPVVTLEGIEGMRLTGDWPFTFKTNWCGEFEVVPSPAPIGVPESPGKAR